MTDIERLSREFAEWKDEQIKHNRYVDDLLENLDENNFSASFKQYISNTIQSSAGFEVIANSDGAMARMFAEYETKFNSSLAEIRAVANAQGAEITSLAQWKSATQSDVASIALIRQQANEQGAEISALVNYTGFDPEYPERTIGSTVAAISRATAEGAVSELTAQFVSESDLETAISEAKQTFHSDADGAYADLITQYKEDHPEDTTMEGETTVNISNIAKISMYANNKDSGISLQANRINFGDTAGVYYNNFYTKYLFDGTGTVETRPGVFWWELGSNFDQNPEYEDGEPMYNAEFALHTMASRDHWEASGSRNDKLFALRFTNGNAVDGDGSRISGSKFAFVAWNGEGLSQTEKEILGYNYSESRTYPKGDWDFSSANVTGLKVYFS